MKIWDMRNYDPLYTVDLKEFGEPDSVSIRPDFRNTDFTYAAVSHE